MEIIQEAFIGAVKVLKPKIFGDNRGFFQESYNEKTFHNLGIMENFIQDNHSFSKECGTLRGLHFQTQPMSQSKIIRVSQGRAMDVIVDIRVGSPTYKEHFSIELNENNQLQIYIPKGFAHGFCTLSDDCHFIYKVDEYYSVEHNCGIQWNDPELGIQWPFDNPTLSTQDENWKPLAQTTHKFVYGSCKY